MMNIETDITCVPNEELEKAIASELNNTITEEMEKEFGDKLEELLKKDN